MICVPILVYRTKKDRLRKDHLHYLQALSMILTSVNNMKTRELKSRVRTNADQQYQMKEISLWWSFMLLKKLPVQYFDDFFFVTWKIHLRKYMHFLQVSYILIIEISIFNMWVFFHCSSRLL